MKFFRTIRFDSSDEHVFERAALSDEWAIPGGFLFSRQDPAALTGKARQAFANGFLSLASGGHATLVSVADIRNDERESLTAGLAKLFVDQFGAPDEQSAANAAAEEIGFVTDMCAGLPINTLMALSRAVDEAGEIRETFRIIEPPSGTPHTRIWDVVEDTADVP